MAQLLYDCNCDTVIEMQEIGVGVEEILQFVHGCLTRDEIRALVAGLEQLVPSAEPVEMYYG